MERSRARLDPCGGFNACRILVAIRSWTRDREDALCDPISGIGGDRPELEEFAHLLEEEDGAVGRLAHRFAPAFSISITMASRFLPDRMALALTDPAGLRDVEHDAVGAGVLDLDGGQVLHLEADVVDAPEAHAALDACRLVILELEDGEVHHAVAQEAARGPGVVDLAHLLHLEDVDVELRGLLDVLRRDGHVPQFGHSVPPLSRLADRPPEPYARQQSNHRPGHHRANRHPSKPKPNNTKVGGSGADTFRADTESPKRTAQP